MKIRLQDGSEVEVEPGDPRTLLEVLEEAGVGIEAACGGFAACNTCRVRVIEGMDALTPVTEEERPFMDEPEQRLACCCQPLGDLLLRLEPGA